MDAPDERGSRAGQRQRVQPPQRAGVIESLREQVADRLAELLVGERVGVIGLREVPVEVHLGSLHPGGPAEPQARLLDPERASAARQIELEVVMQGGTEYRGRAVLELPPSRSRSLDYLNGAGVFFALASDDVSWYINKSRVRFARPLD